MPLFMDRHDMSGEKPVTAEDVARFHLEDLKVQDKYGVKVLTYWFDYETQMGFCLIDAPNRESAQAVHAEGHGYLPSKIIEVNPGLVEGFLGRIEETPAGKVISEGGLRAILFTDMAGSTELTQRLGDEKAMQILRAHDAIIRQSVADNGGHIVKHTGDGMLAAFSSVVSATRASAEIQKKLEEAELPVEILVRVGLTAGEPVAESEDLFGASVQMAARICGACEPGEILGSNVVRDLSLGKGLDWRKKGEVQLRGFDDPVTLHELLWRS
ncbi:MAG: nickel-binding protein [Actinomycetota bacterium]